MTLFAPIQHAAVDLADADAFRPTRITHRSTRRRSYVVPAPAQWELDTAITVVLFAGLGGACQGLEEAGCPVDVANNHSAVALAAHAAMHPHTRHVKGDIFDVDPLKATRGRRVKILWASPDCTDHSVAKGGAPRGARVRSLPWQICRWAGKTGPSVIMMENVREIRGWGPLVAKRDRATGRVLKADGSVARPGERVRVQDQQLTRDKGRLGRSYRRFIAHLRALGYEVEARDLCCADYGVPTSRRRWFAVARRDGEPIRWPARTHAPAAKARELGLEPWVGAHTVIDWSLPIPSIFDRTRSLAEATHRRIAAGLRRYVVESPAPFILPLTHKGPPRTLDLKAPLSTVVTRAGPQAVAAACLVKLRGQSTANDAVEPLSTITSGGGHLAATAAFLTQYYSQGSTDQSLDDPLRTVTCKSRHGIVTVDVGGAPYVIADIGMRMLEPTEAAAAHELTLPAAIVHKGKRRALTKTESMHLVGNSVPKRMARLLAQANRADTLARPRHDHMAAD